jgi:uncharacterized protein YndB with AHSA1/START domain
MKDWNHPIVVEETYRATPDRVWAALSVRERMVEWYFDKIEAFEPRVGFETRFTVSTGEREFVHVWTVTEMRENERLAYRWRYDNYDGDGNVTFEICEEGEGTKLRLTAVVTEPFLPADLPEFQRESGVAGWKYLLQESLKSYLES